MTNVYRLVVSGWHLKPIDAYKDKEKYDSNAYIL